MSDIAIRPYDAADRVTLADLWVAAWQATLPEIDFAARRSWICERLDDQAASGTVTLCAVASTGLVGFAMVEPARCHLEQIAVAPMHRGSGAAGRLLDAVKQLSPARLTLRVNQDNPRAARFYTREGFRIIAEGTNPGGRRLVWDMEWRPDVG